MFEECFGDGPFIFRLNENGTGPQLLTQVCLERGWREYNAETIDQWNLWWRTSGFPIGHYKSLYAWQYINHIPKGSSICRKDNLVRYLRCMKKVYGSIYDFSPPGYNLPLEYTKLAAECSRGGGGGGSAGGRPYTPGKGGGCSTPTQFDRLLMEDRPVWICKPVAQSQGRGIFLFRKLSELTYDSNTIVQRYIEKPLLIGGYKFDLRLYVCIPSYYPLTVYMYKEGLARFGTDKFSLNDLRNPFRHLTNSSINKLGPGYTELKDRIGSGCKWTLRQLRRYFQQAGISDWLLWQKITSLVILTVLSHVTQIPPTVNCFEFFGFDVLIDSSLRPWLLEVNLSPALSNDCDADRCVKKPMLHDMFDLLGLPLYNTGLSIYNSWREHQQDDNVCENDENSNDMLKNALSVLNAAGKWRRKQKRMSSKRPNSRSNSAARSKLRTPKNTPKAYKLSKSKPSFDADFQNKQNDELWKRSNGQKKWGNGRDWRTAPSTEGGWIRIWPMRLETSNRHHENEGSIKQMVMEMVKFTRLSKEIFRKHPQASECQLTEFLQEELDITEELWIPPV